MSRIASLAIPMTLLLAVILTYQRADTAAPASEPISSPECLCSDCRCGDCDCLSPIQAVDIKPAEPDPEPEPEAEPAKITAQVGRASGIVTSINGHPATSLGDGRYSAGGRIYRIPDRVADSVFFEPWQDAGTCRIVNGRVICN